MRAAVAGAALRAGCHLLVAQKRSESLVLDLSELGLDSPVHEIVHGSITSYDVGIVVPAIGRIHNRANEEDPELFVELEWVSLPPQIAVIARFEQSAEAG